MYLDITEDINIDLRKIDNVLSFIKVAGLLIAMDSNARSSTWHVTTNNRGRELGEYLITNIFFVINENRETTFENNRRMSNIDLTVVNSYLMPMLHQRQCSKETSCSDHRIITFITGKYILQSKENIFASIKIIIKEEKLNDSGKQVLSKLIQKYSKGIRTNNMEETDEAFSRLIAGETDTKPLIEEYEELLNLACRKEFKTCKSLQINAEESHFPGGQMN